jgi:hypothetical protein
VGLVIGLDAAEKMKLFVFPGPEHRLLGGPPCNQPLYRLLIHKPTQYIVYLNKSYPQFQKKQRVVICCSSGNILSRDQVTLDGFKLLTVIIELE